MYHIEFYNLLNPEDDTLNKFAFPTARAFESIEAAKPFACALAEEALAFLKANEPDTEYSIVKENDAIAVAGGCGPAVFWVILQWKDQKIQLISRNVDGLRLAHEYSSVDDMLSDWNSDDPTMGDNEIQLVVMEGATLYSSLGKSMETYEETLRTAQVMDWFAPGGTR